MNGMRRQRELVVVLENKLFVSKKDINNHYV